MVPVQPGGNLAGGIGLFDKQAFGLAHFGPLHGKDDVLIPDFLELIKEYPAVAPGGVGNVHVPVVDVAEHHKMLVIRSINEDDHRDGHLLQILHLGDLVAVRGVPQGVGIPLHVEKGKAHLFDFRLVAVLEHADDGLEFSGRQAVVIAQDGGQGGGAAAVIPGLGDHLALPHLFHGLDMLDEDSALFISVHPHRHLGGRDSDRQEQH
jgi:hypothetical protein